MSNIIKAIQEIYPDISGGFVYWESKQDGSPLDNPIDGLKWENTEYEKPTWEQIESKLSALDLQEAKDKKKAEIKALREEDLNKPTPRTVIYEGNLSNRSFNISVKDHLPIFESIINKLSRLADSGVENPTREWTDASGQRVALDINDYTSLANHLDLRDEAEYSQANLKIKEVEALTTIEEVEAYDINKVIA